MEGEKAHINMESDRNNLTTSEDIRIFAKTKINIETLCM